MGKTIRGACGRFEEIGTLSDDDDIESTDLAGTYRGDELHFTGADLGQLSRRRKVLADSESDDSGEASEETGRGKGRELQLALRDKEDLLVEKALQRIRRAQELGKTNVKLSQSELDALQRKRRKDGEQVLQPRPKDRHRTRKPANKEKDRSRRVDEPRTRDDRQIPLGSQMPPGMLVPSNSGVPLYAPLPYQPLAALPAPSSSRGGSRVPSAQNLARNSPESARKKGKRNSTAPALYPPAANSSARSLPDDPNWMPRPRSNSSLTSSPYVHDAVYPYHYQHPSPPRSQRPVQSANQTRRIVSSPQPHPRDRLPRYEASRPESRRESTSEASSSSDDDDDSDAGVQVDVVPDSSGQGYRIRTASEGRRERGGSRR